MFFPLVVLVAVLPGLYALSRWDLNPPGPWWGLRGLAVLQGYLFDQAPASTEVGPPSEGRAFRAVALQPPLYAWLEALGFGLNVGQSPLATVLPSYIAGVFLVLLAFYHGRIWQGPALGVVAAVLLGFNPNLLLQMQQATPVTLALASSLLALLCYIQVLHATTSDRSSLVWAFCGGLALGIGLMAVGGFALACVPVVLLHQAYLFHSQQSTQPWHSFLKSPSLWNGAIALGIAAFIAVPWHFWMYLQYGIPFLVALRSPPDNPLLTVTGMLPMLMTLAPVTFPLALVAVIRTLIEALPVRGDHCPSVGSVFWILWLAVAALLPRMWPTGSHSAFDLFLLAPLNLLAAKSVIDLASRRATIYWVAYLAPAALLGLIWWVNAPFRRAVLFLTLGRQPDLHGVLQLHLVFDLLVAVGIAVMGLLYWARNNDRRQRIILGTFLATVMTIVAVSGVREVRFRHRETKDLLTLREVILRLHEEQPFSVIAVVGATTISNQSPLQDIQPGGRLRFILRSALPKVPLVDLNSTEDLLTLSGGQCLVVLVGQQRLPYALQARLGLWAIHPGRSGMLDAFATAREDHTVLRR